VCERWRGRGRGVVKIFSKRNQKNLEIVACMTMRGKERSRERERGRESARERARERDRVTAREKKEKAQIKWRALLIKCRVLLIECRVLLTEDKALLMKFSALIGETVAAPRFSKIQGLFERI